MELDDRHILLMARPALICGRPWQLLDLIGENVFGRIYFILYHIQVPNWIQIFHLEGLLTFRVAAWMLSTCDFARILRALHENIRDSFLRVWDVSFAGLLWITIAVLRRFPFWLGPNRFNLLFAGEDYILVLRVLTDCLFAHVQNSWRFGFIQLSFFGHVNELALFQKFRAFLLLQIWVH